MATQKSPEVQETIGSKLAAEWKTAFDALAPIRSTWDEKERALLAMTADSFSGKTTTTRVSDAALSTLAYERQARVSAQLPTGRVYALSKKDEEKAKKLNIILTRYILPNADSQFDMLIKLRLWGVYASVYGSMPMFYDYRTDSRYIGPECYLVDPRKFAPVSGFHNVQDAGCFISTTFSRTQLEEILERKTTSYSKPAIRALLAAMQKGSKPSSDDDAEQSDTNVSQRYDKTNAEDRADIITKYTHKKWVSFAPDFPEVDPIRDMDNPHKSGRVPVVMRHCFPLLNSIFGLGDFERGMKIQKAKDSIINLFLEGSKNRIFPPLKIISNQLTPSTIKYEAGAKWQVKNQQAVEPMNFGQAPLGEFQATYAALQGMLQNQFGTSTTEITSEQGGPSMGKTPQALKMQASRENARDTWDRFMHEKATEELFEGMLNLLHVKMEKPIDMSIFEEDIQALGYKGEQHKNGEIIPAEKVPGLDTFSGDKAGTLTIKKDDIKSDLGYSYLIDANSSMKQDDEEQFQALMATWQLTHSTPELAQNLMMSGMEYNEADHLKKIFIAAGITDWEKILKEVSPEKQAELEQQKQQAQQMEQQMQLQMAQASAPQQPQPPMQGGMPPEAMQGAPQGQQIPPELLQMLAAQQQPQPQMVQPGQPQFEDPDIAEFAQMLLGGAR